MLNIIRAFDQQRFRLYATANLGHVADSLFFIEVI